MAVEKSEVEIKELISELNDLRFKITDSPPETIPGTKAEVLKAQSDILSALRDMEADERDLNFVKEAFAETQDLLAKISNLLATKGYQEEIRELISGLDRKYCNLQLFLSELDIPNRPSDRVYV